MGSCYQRSAVMSLHDLSERANHLFPGSVAAAQPATNGRQNPPLYLRSLTEFDRFHAITLATRIQVIARFSSC
jgi:hypothetical protein